MNNQSNDNVDVCWLFTGMLIL